MTRKLTLTAAFILGFLSLGIITDSVTSGGTFINKALAGGDGASGGASGGKP